MVGIEDNKNQRKINNIRGLINNNMIDLAQFNVKAIGNVIREERSDISATEFANMLINDWNNLDWSKYIPNEISTNQLKLSQIMQFYKPNLNNS